MESYSKRWCRITCNIMGSYFMELATLESRMVVSHEVYASVHNLHKLRFGAWR